jgi:hypothetical protein
MYFVSWKLENEITTFRPLGLLKISRLPFCGPTLGDDVNSLGPGTSRNLQILQSPLLYQVYPPMNMHRLTSCPSCSNRICLDDIRNLVSFSKRPRRVNQEHTCALTFSSTIMGTASSAGFAQISRDTTSSVSGASHLSRDEIQSRQSGQRGTADRSSGVPLEALAPFVSISCWARLKQAAAPPHAV